MHRNTDPLKYQWGETMFVMNGESLAQDTISPNLGECSSVFEINSYNHPQAQQ